MTADDYLPTPEPEQPRSGSGLAPYIALFVASAVALIFVCILAPGKRADAETNAPAPAVSAVAMPDVDSFYQATRVYGKAGCGDEKLAIDTSLIAYGSGVPANVLAALVAVESNCNPLAVSSRGAIGLTQVMPSVWSASYEWQETNLLNGHENLRVGSEILGLLIKKYGIRGGVAHYNGTGEAANAYADKVLALAK